MFVGGSLEEYAMGVGGQIGGVGKTNAPKTSLKTNQGKKSSGSFVADTTWSRKKHYGRTGGGGKNTTSGGGNKSGYS